MSDQIGTVAVADDDALEIVLTRLRSAGTGGRRVALAIPAGSGLFLTAAEFRALKDAVDRERLAIEVRSSDPLRLQLARMLGLEAVPEARPRPAPPPPAAPASVPAKPAARPAPSPPRASPPRPTDPASASLPPSSTRPTSAAARSPAAVAQAPTPVAEPTDSVPSAPMPVAPAPHTATPKDPAPSAPAPITRASPEVSTASDERTDVAGPAKDWPAPPPPAASPPARPGRRAPALSLTRLRRRGEGTTPLPDASASDAPVAIASPTLSPSETKPNGPAPAASAATAEAVQDEATDEPPTADRSVSHAGPAWRRRLPERRRPLLVGAAVAAVALIAAAIALLLPRAEVSVVLRRAPVRAELLFDVTVDGTPLEEGAAFAVQGEPATVDVAFEGTIPTTGTRTEPDGTAGGTVRLANPTAEEITVEAGTIVATEEGVEFAFEEDVAVPAADPAAGEVGAAMGRVRALEPGAIGNVESGEIGGRLPNGVYFSNRDGPTEGGTDREIRVVAPEDLQTLRARAEQAMPALADEAFATELGDRTAALPSSFTLGEGTEEFDHEAGDDAESLRLRAVRSVTALTYDPSDVLSQADDELQDRMVDGAPNGYAIAAGTIEVDQPDPVEEGPEGMRFRLAAEAEARAILDAEERQDLAERLAGAEPEAAEALLRDVPEIEEFDIAYRPGWLPDRMPGNADRIAIEPRT